MIDKIDSNKGTPKSDTASTFSTSTGKDHKALPALPAPEYSHEHTTPFEAYEVEEVDHDYEMAQRR